jgi:soluble lytic murein transglycosylase
MPTVPRIDAPQVSPGGPSSARFDAPQAQNYAARQGVQMGQAMEAAGAEASRIAADIQAQANQLRFDDAINQVKEEQLRLTYDKDAGYSNLKGINALQRPDGKPLKAEYGDLLKKRIGEIGASLGNDAQKAAFDKASANILTGFVGQVDAHESSEFKTYGLSVSEGVQATAKRDIALNWSKPEAIDAAVERIRAEAYRQGQLLGKSAEWQEAAARKMTSDGHKVAVLSALENNNPAYADTYLKKYAGQMEADDIMAVRGHITKQMDAQSAVVAATAEMKRAAPQMAPTDADRAFNILLGTESGSKQFDDNGRPLTSRKGAIGIAQVMPATAPEAAKLAGLPWDENRYRTDAEYNKALGRAYFNKQLQDFGGDLSLAYAAYNAGPGAVRKALKGSGRQVVVEANADPSAPKRIEWLSLLPKETQNYVAKNMAAFSGGQGTPPRPTLADIDARLQANNPDLAANPQRLKLAREEVARQFKMQEDALKQRDEGALAEAQRQLVANGGNYAGLPASVRNAIPPGKVDEVMGFAGKIAKGAPLETDWSLYYQLKTNPDALQAANLMAFRSKLGDSEFKALVSQQEDLRSGKDLTQVRTTRDVLSQYMREAGIDPTPKDTDKTGAEKVGRIWAAFESRVREREQAKGGKLTPEEVQKTAAQLFTKVGVSGMLWDSEKPAVMLEAGDKIKVPDSERSKITAALSRAGRPVTEENIVALYRRAQGIN